MATDGGNPPRSATLPVHVIVKDINDNAPQFEQPEIRIDLDEDSHRGKRLLQLRATDADADSKIVYRLEKPIGDANPFALTQLGGENTALLIM